MRFMEGKGVSKGVVKGPICFYQRAAAAVSNHASLGMEAEKRRLEDAKAASIEQLNALAEQAREEAGSDAALLFETHSMFIEDEDFCDCMDAALMEQPCTAERAVELAGEQFSAMLADPVELAAWMVLTVLAGFLVVSFGLQKGLERITKWMMMGLLTLIVVLAVHSLTLSGGMEGVKFYLLPDFQRAAEAGLGNVITAAMNQAFFTLSLGIAAMEIFGSYMSRDNTLTSEAVRICLLDTFVALMAGLIIFPACFAFDVEPGQGPALIFMILPKVFLNMAGGRLWGALFFLFMTFASFSTVIAVFENLQANAIDNFGWSRKKAALANCVFILIASMPCVLGYNLWSGLHLIGGRDVLDSEDFIVSNLLLPLGSLVYLLFCVSKKGWGYDRYLEEANAGEGIKMPRWLWPYFQFALPVLILIILIQGLL